MFSLRSNRSRSNLTVTPTPLAPISTTSAEPALLSPLQLLTPPLSDSSDTATRSATSSSSSPEDFRTWNGSQARERGRNAEDGGSSARSLSGFFKRVRSRSRGRREEKGQEVVDAPPVPRLPSMELGEGFASRAGGVGMGIRMEGKGSKSLDRWDGVAGEDKTAVEEGDLGDLLYLVHAAGDKFDPPPHSRPLPASPQLPPSQRTTPILTSSPTFSSPSSPSSPITPKPYYSFLSHLHRNTLNSYQPLTPPLSPLASPPLKADDSGSEDDYGGSSDEEQDPWRRKPTSSFGVRRGLTSIPSPLVPRQQLPHPLIISSPRPRRRALGPRAKELLDYSLLRLSPSSSTLHHSIPVRYQPSALQQPLSTNSHRRLETFGPVNSVGVILGRTLIARKLSRGLTMLESMEIERPSRGRDSQDSQRSSSTSSSFDESAPRSSPPSLSTLLERFEVNVEQPCTAVPHRPSTSPLSLPRPPPSPSRPPPGFLPSQIRTWIARPSFCDGRLVTTSVEGGMEMVDLVRPTRGSGSAPRLAVSERMKALAAEGEGGGQGLESHWDGGRLVGAEKGEDCRSRLAEGGRRSLGPGPLLLRTLEHQKVGGQQDSSDEEEDLPLAVLRSRASASPLVSKMVSKENEAAAGRSLGRCSGHLSAPTSPKRRSAAPPIRTSTLDIPSPRPSPSASTPSPISPPSPHHLWPSPLLSVPPPGWGIVNVPMMMPLPSHQSLAPPPLRFSTSAPSLSTTSPFSTFAQAGSHRPPMPPLPHSHSTPQRLSQPPSNSPRSTSQRHSALPRPPQIPPTSTRRSFSHVPSSNQRKSATSVPPLLKAGYTASAEETRSSRRASQPTSQSMARSRSSPEASEAQKEREKAWQKLVGGGGVGLGAGSTGQQRR